MTSGEAIRKLREAGFQLLKISKDSHWVFIHPNAPNEWIMVPMHGKKDLSPGVEAVIRKALRLQR
jgi:predicted RNA binding protein YcfA (HicA-like mRNA interferase family)